MHKTLQQNWAQREGFVGQRQWQVQGSCPNVGGGNCETQLLQRWFDEHFAGAANVTMSSVRNMQKVPTQTSALRDLRLDPHSASSVFCCPSPSGDAIFLHCNLAGTLATTAWPLHWFPQCYIQEVAAEFWGRHCRKIQDIKTIGLIILLSPSLFRTLIIILY